MFLIFIICFIFAVVWLIRKRGSKIAVNDIFWLLACWAFVFGIYYTSGIIYRVKISGATIVYIILTFCIYLCARFVGIYFLKPIYNSNDSLHIDSIEFTQGWFWVGTLAFIIYVIDLIRNNSIVFGVKTDLNFSAIGKIAIYIMPVLASIWLYELGDALKKNKKVALRGWLSLILYCLQIILSSGRMNIIMILIATIAEVAYINAVITHQSMFSRVNSTAKRNLKYIGFGVIAIIIFYFIFLSNTRYGNHMIEMFEYASGCTISYSTTMTLNRTGVFASVILNGMYYFSHQLSKLEIIFKYYKGPLLFGGYQFNFFDGIYNLFGINMESHNSAVVSMLGLFNLQGLRSGWDTVLGASIYDFGRVGTFFYVAILGLLVGLSVNKFKNEPFSILRIVIQSWLCSGMFMTLELGPFYNRSWPFAMIWACLIPKIRFTFKNK